MRHMGNRDEILRIKQLFTTILNLLRGERIHVVDQWAVGYVATQDTEVAAVVPNENLITEASPFGGPIESLVEGAVVAECGLSDYAANSKVAVTLFETFKG